MSLLIIGEDFYPSSARFVDLNKEGSYKIVGLDFKRGVRPNLPNPLAYGPAI